MELHLLLVYTPFVTHTFVSVFPPVKPTNSNQIKKNEKFSNV